MINLRVKKLHPDAKLPVCSHPGSDLGYDVFALEDTTLNVKNNHATKVRTGIAIALECWGFIVKDRSSMAARGIYTHAGVVDEGYRGEIIILLTSAEICVIHAGDKIAQLIPVIPATNFTVIECDNLDDSSRGSAGFGSTGR